jgi:hypothetical protein
MITSIGLHLYQPTRFPEPAALGVETLIAISAAIIIAVQLPWSRISFGGVEIERVLKAQANEHADDLRELLPRSTSSNNRLRGSSGNDDVAEETIRTGGGTENNKSNVKDQLLSMLSSVPSRGMSIDGIRLESARGPGFDAIQQLSRAELRLALTELINDGFLNLHMNTSGSTIYHSK